MSSYGATANDLSHQFQSFCCILLLLRVVEPKGQVSCRCRRVILWLHSNITPDASKKLPGRCCAFLLNCRARVKLLFAHFSSHETSFAVFQMPAVFCANWRRQLQSACFRMALVVFSSCTELCEAQQYVLLLLKFRGAMHPTCAPDAVSAPMEGRPPGLVATLEPVTAVF